MSAPSKIFGVTGEPAGGDDILWQFASYTAFVLSVAGANKDKPWGWSIDVPGLPTICDLGFRTRDEALLDLRNKLQVLVKAFKEVGS